MGVKSKIKEAKEDVTEFASDVWEKVTGYLLAAFGLVAGLAWNDAIKAIIQTVWPIENEGARAQLIYAIAMTLLVIVVTAIFVKLSKKNQKEKATKEALKKLK